VVHKNPHELKTLGVMTHSYKLQPIQTSEDFPKRYTLQHTATHCNTPQHTANHCNAPQHTATHCNTLQHTATHLNTLQMTATHLNTLQHTATHCNTLLEGQLVGKKRGYRAEEKRRVYEGRLT